jgi:hypothetical protein
MARTVLTEEEEQLAALHEWEDEAVEGSTELSDLAMLYIEQIKELQEQLGQEILKVQKLEMAIKGFNMSLQEEMK